jgi:hypothetical protein
MHHALHQQHAAEAEAEDGGGGNEWPCRRQHSADR